MGRPKDSFGVSAKDVVFLMDVAMGNIPRAWRRSGGPPRLPEDIAAPAALSGLFFVGLLLHVTGSNALLQRWTTGCPHLLEGFSNKWIKPDSWPTGGITT